VWSRAHSAAAAYSPAPRRSARCPQCHSWSPCPCRPRWGPGCCQASDTPTCRTPHRNRLNRQHFLRKREPRCPMQVSQESRPSAQTQPENLHSLRPVRLPWHPKPLQALVPGPHRPAAARALHAGRPVLANCALGSFRLSAPCTRRRCAATQCSVQPPQSSLPARARPEGGFMSNVTTGAL